MAIQYFEDGDYALYDGLIFRRDKRKGYYLNAKTHKRLHVYVWEHHNGAVPEGCHVHHKDFDKRNNEIENLELLTAHEHQKLHGAALDDGERQRRRNNLVENARPKASEWHGSEVGHEWHRQHYERMKEKLHRTITLKCAYCGKAFEAVDNGKNKYCSNACNAAARRASGIDNEKRICVVCGKEYEVNRYAKSKTCSRSCANRLRWRGEGGTDS